ncbi:extracellular catalytic domain type 2 short-chain-length polyhydroxyalkanoate depolymerase [Marinobacterium jannaschii]|uniref:extracellular catalytic domain type 2 short-chain-length polyhydroxyalkanoate depolymerase n=1 Tax=Marinobacterium jannaschii TaxID=64970 RepID=UPI0012ECBA2E|nr:poly(3-hydroxybutyrate) depolymerase [Marinobacterium jannaschii]
MPNKLFSLAAPLICTLLLSATTAVKAQDSGTLPKLAALQGQTSVSGLSSGAFMAAQFHIAYSEELVGAGVIAGGPWNCARSHTGLPSINAMSVCMNPCSNPWMPCNDHSFPDTDRLREMAERSEKQGDIDTLANLTNDKVYLFSGQSDQVVVTGVMNTTQDFYAKVGVPASNIRYNRSVDAGHAMVTDQPDDTPCSLTESPFINNCGFEQTERLLQHIYGALEDAANEATGRMLQFNQKEFYGDDSAGFADTGYLYVPAQCEEASCRIHVAFHGCEQSVSAVGHDFIEGAGYNEIADNNRIIVLYPQIKSSLIPVNPMGCWDFWGYNDLPMGPYHFYRKDAPQMKAVAAMIERLTASR